MKHTAFVLAVVASLGLAASAYAGLSTEQFDVGNATGYAEMANDPNGWVSVSTTIVSNGARVGLELDKYWMEPSGSPTGSIDNFDLSSQSLPASVPAGPVRSTNIVLPTAAAAGQSTFDILLTDEKLYNNTINAWTDFHIEIELTGGDGSLVVLNSPLPGTTLPQVDSSVAGGVYKFDFYGGVWPNDGVPYTLFDNHLVNSLTLRVSLGLEDQVITLREWPTMPVPEPATMGLLGAGSAGLLVLRRRRRK